VGAKGVGSLMFYLLRQTQPVLTPATPGLRGQGAC